MVLFGPIADAASEKLATELPEEFVIASEYRLIDKKSPPLLQS